MSTMLLPGQELAQTFEGGIIALSFIIAVVGSQTALEILGKRTSDQGRHNWVLLIGAGVSMGGVAIWAMHYVGNFSLTLWDGTVAFQLRYNIWFTILSLVVSVTCLCLALYFCDAAEKPRWERTLIAGTMAGVGVSLMHYCGQFAVRDYIVTYDAWTIVVATLIAITASCVALHIFFALRARWETVWYKRLGASVLMAIAVCGMHYVGMAGSHYHMPDFPTDAMTSHMNRTLIISCVTAMVFLMCCGLIGYAAFVESRKNATVIQRVTKDGTITPKVVMALAIFDKQNQLMVDNDGLPPCIVITNPFFDTQPGFGKNEFTNWSELFLWCFRISWDWSLVELYLMFLDKKSDLIRPNSYGLGFRQLFVFGATKLAHQVGVPLSTIGVLYDKILETSSVPMDQTSILRRRNPEKPLELQNLNHRRSEASLQTVGGGNGAAPVEPPKGQMIFLTQHTSIAGHYAAHGYRFVNPHLISRVMANRFMVDKEVLMGFISDMADFNSSLETARSQIASQQHRLTEAALQALNNASNSTSTILAGVGSGGEGLKPRPVRTGPVRTITNTSGTGGVGGVGFNHSNKSDFLSMAPGTGMSSNHNSVYNLNNNSKSSTYIPKFSMDIPSRTGGVAVSLLLFRRSTSTGLLNILTKDPERYQAPQVPLTMHLVASELQLTRALALFLEAHAGKSMPSVLSTLLSDLSVRGGPAPIMAPRGSYRQDPFAGGSNNNSTTNFNQQQQDQNEIRSFAIVQSQLNSAIRNALSALLGSLGAASFDMTSETILLPNTVDVVENNGNRLIVFYGMMPGAFRDSTESSQPTLINPLQPPNSFTSGGHNHTNNIYDIDQQQQQQHGGSSSNGSYHSGERPSTSSSPRPISRASFAASAYTGQIAWDGYCFHPFDIYETYYRIMFLAGRDVQEDQRWRAIVGHEMLANLMGTMTPSQLGSLPSSITTTSPPLSPTRTLTPGMLESGAASHKSGGQKSSSSGTKKHHKPTSSSGGSAFDDFESVGTVVNTGNGGRSSTPSSPPFRPGSMTPRLQDYHQNQHLQRSQSSPQQQQVPYLPESAAYIHHQEYLDQEYQKREAAASARPSLAAVQFNFEQRRQSIPERPIWVQEIVKLLEVPHVQEHEDALDRWA